MMTEYSDYIQEVVKTKKVGFLFHFMPHLNKLMPLYYYQV